MVYPSEGKTRQKMAILALDLSFHRERSNLVHRGVSKNIKQGSAEYRGKKRNNLPNDWPRVNQRARHRMIRKV